MGYDTVMAKQNGANHDKNIHHRGVCVEIEGWSNWGVIIPALMLTQCAIKMHARLTRLRAKPRARNATRHGIATDAWTVRIS